MEQTGTAGVAAGHAAAQRITLPATGARALAIQAVLLVSASFLLPAAAHIAGLPVRQLLPMHWPVILVGLVYGWRSGLVVGLAAPTLSYLISGMPLPVVLPAMTVELAAYGALAGGLRELLRWSPFLATAGALVGGRLVFLIVAIVTGATGSSLSGYLVAAMVPGLAAGLLQLLTLPFVARWWVSRGTSGTPDTRV